MRKKRCTCCHELYEPEPRSYRRQKTCKKPACRAWRKRQAVHAWKKNNPLYARTEPITYKQWCKEHPRYWRQWRQYHAGYVARNRRAQRVRNAKNRGLIAKGNDLNSICIEKLRQNASVRLIAKGNDIDMRGIFVRKYRE